MNSGLKNLKKLDEQLLVPAARERRMDSVLSDLTSRFGLILTEREISSALQVGRDRAFTSKETEAIARAVCYASMVRNGDVDGALKRFNFMKLDPEIKEKYGPDFDKTVLAEMEKLDKNAAKEFIAKMNSENASKLA